MGRKSLSQVNTFGGVDISKKLLMDIEVTYGLYIK